MLPFIGMKTSRDAYLFFTYRRYFFIFSLKIHEYRRYLYKHRRYVKNGQGGKELSMPMQRHFPGRYFRLDGIRVKVF